MAETYERPEDFEEQALKNWTSGTDANEKQAKREKEDLSWQVPENQWDEGARAARGANRVGDVGIPPRPMLSIPKIKQPMSLVDNQFRSAHLGVNIHPISEDADDETAEVFQDLYRAIERDSNAGQARWWAFDRAKQCGRGWYRFNTVYDDQTADPFDQKVLIERILYQDAVVMDPSATKADCSDAGWAFLSAWLPIEVFRRRWPDAAISKASDSTSSDPLELDQMCSMTPNWVKSEKKAVQVSEYWCKHYTTETVKSPDGKRSRIKEKVKLMWYVLAPGGPSGLEVVEEQEWNGDDIPLIPAYGTELQPFDEDGERRFEGMIRPARDGQKLYNFAASTAVEKMASLPKSPWILDIESIEGYEGVWDQSNTRLFPYLPWKSSVDGRPMTKPERVQDDGSGLQPIMVILQQADEFIQSSTATPDPVLGKRNSKAESGKAIAALQGQSEASNSSFIQNFADVTMMYEAKVGIGMIKRIYDRPGRVVSALNVQGEGRQVILNADFVMEGGKPRPAPMAPAGMAPQMRPPMTTTGAAPMPMQGQPQKPVKKYDLSKGYYGVSVTIGKSYNTKREQGVDLLSAIMERDPQLGMVLAPVMLRFMDGPGMKEAADLAKEFRDRQMPGLGAAKEGEESPEQLKQMLQAAKAQIEQMQQAGQQMQDEIKTDVAKQQATMSKAQIDAELETQRLQMEFEKAKLQAETAIRVAEINAGAKIDSNKLDALMSLVLDKSKAEQAAFDRRHAADLTHTELAHDVAASLGGQEHDSDMAERGHEQGMEAQQMAQEAESAQEDAQEGSEE